MLNLDKMNKMPPSLVRLIARQPDGRRKPLTNREISEASGLSVDEVKEISLTANWDDIPVGTLVKFCGGCGITHENFGAHLWYVRRSYGEMVRPFSHLRNLSGEDGKFVDQLVERLKSM